MDIFSRLRPKIIQAAAAAPFLSASLFLVFGNLLELLQLLGRRKLRNGAAKNGEENNKLKKKEIDGSKNMQRRLSLFLL